ncbi:hypothetical protein AB0L00_18850 [Actinoallomurus sp. NPDC052308]|uniref:hypothetical protein n=1 Tax=Actinoallomurus sp. NPDC052308 TaxID=3155530 RepID=UPI00343F1F37
MKKTILGALVTVAAGAVVSITPTAAHAEPWPSGCKDGYMSPRVGTWARCASGAGYVRAIAKCHQRNGSGQKTVYGPWKWVGETSRAMCGPNWIAVGHTHTIKH